MANPNGFFSASSTRDNGKLQPYFNSIKSKKESGINVSSFSPTEKLHIEKQDRKRLIEIPELSNIEMKLTNSSEKWLYQDLVRFLFVIFSNYLSPPNLFEMPYSSSNFFNTSVICKNKIINESKRNMILKFENQFSEKFIVKREWYNYKNDATNKNQTNENLEHWIENQIKKYALMKFAGENEYFISPLDFTFIQNSTLNLFISEIVFKIPSQTFKDVYQSSLQHLANLLFQLSVAVSFISSKKIYFETIKEKSIYIDNTSELMKLKILPFLLVLNKGKIQNDDKENVNASNFNFNHSIKRSSFLSKYHPEETVYCNFDPSISSALTKIATSLMNILNQESKEKNQKNEKEKKETLCEHCLHYLQTNKFTYREFPDFFNLIMQLNLNENLINEEHKRMISHQKRQSISQHPNKDESKKDYHSQFDKKSQNIENKLPLSSNPTFYLQKNNLSPENPLILKKSDVKSNEINFKNKSINERSFEDAAQEIGRAHV